MDGNGTTIGVVSEIKSGDFGVKRQRDIDKKILHGRNPEKNAEKLSEKYADEAATTGNKSNAESLKRLSVFHHLFTETAELVPEASRDDFLVDIYNPDGKVDSDDQRHWTGSDFKVVSGGDDGINNEDMKNYLFGKLIEYGNVKQEDYAKLPEIVDKYLTPPKKEENLY